jgi:hypothetical protein
LQFRKFLLANKIKTKEIKSGFYKSLPGCGPKLSLPELPEDVQYDSDMMLIEAIKAKLDVID